MTVYHGWFERVGREPCLILPGVVFDPHSNLEGPCKEIVLVKERRPMLARISEVIYAFGRDEMVDQGLCEAPPVRCYEMPADPLAAKAGA